MSAAANQRFPRWAGPSEVMRCTVHGASLGAGGACLQGCAHPSSVSLQGARCTVHGAGTVFRASHEAFVL